MRMFQPQQQTRFYCGVDLHARSMYAHILDHTGKTLLDRDLPANPETFLDAVKPYRDGLVVGAECMFAWYWLADLCEDQHIVPPNVITDTSTRCAASGSLITSVW